MWLSQNIERGVDGWSTRVCFFLVYLPGFSLNSVAFREFRSLLFSHNAVKVPSFLPSETSPTREFVKNTNEYGTHQRDSTKSNGILFLYILFKLCEQVQLLSERNLLSSSSWEIGNTPLCVCVCESSVNKIYVYMTFTYSCVYPCSVCN